MKTSDDNSLIHKKQILKMQFHVSIPLILEKVKESTLNSKLHEISPLQISKSGCLSPAITIHAPII